MSAPVPMITTSQLAIVHTLAKRAGMDQDVYRDFLESQAGVRTAKDLTAAKAARVIDRLKDLTGHAGVAGAVAGLDTPVARKLRALWIAGHNLGLVRERSDRAMLAFLERQTGVSHTRFLDHPGSASSAIEALKSWLARKGGVRWPADLDDAIAARRAVVEAQWARLVALGGVRLEPGQDPGGALEGYAFKVVSKNGWCFFEARDYDLVQAALGRRLRAVLMQRRENGEDA